MKIFIFLVCHRIELSFPSNQIGHLLGRHGHLHKSLMEATGTRIHFDNVPYSISLGKQCPEFNLDLFQSSQSLTATITGPTLESVEHATKELEELVRVTPVCKIYFRNKKKYLSYFLLS